MVLSTTPLRVASPLVLRSRLQRMRINIASNIDNGKGLERDYQLLRAELERLGHEVCGVHSLKTILAPAADLTIFLEVPIRFAGAAPRNWLIPNPEWWSPLYNQTLPIFEHVLCKTRHALEIFSGLTARARYLGFISEDRWDEHVPRERRFLHVAGGSRLKGTEFVLEAWDRRGITYPLTVVSRRRWAPRSSQVQCVRSLDDLELKRVQNAAMFHLSPSRYEGWGHVIHEGLSVGAAVAIAHSKATDGFQGVALRMPSVAAGKQGLVDLSSVSPDVVRDAVDRCAGFTDNELRRVAREAREAFLGQRATFVTELEQLLAG